MKYLSFLLIGLSLNNCLANEYSYEVVENDQLGVILLSLGHKKLWSKNGKVNQFKTSSLPDLIWPGSILKVSSDDIVFKKNVIIENNEIKFHKMIKTIPEYDLCLSNENIPEVEMPNERPQISIVAPTKDIKEKTIHSFNIYPGIGGFIASNNENDRGVTTSTLSGFQPIVQLKGIYSTNLFGSLSIDLLTKKIISSQFSFPQNIDYRIQIVPKWNFSEKFKFAVSHSFLQHSYVGKNSTVEVPYKLTSNFVGLGIVVPRDSFWFEIYIEKAYTGETKSSETTQKATSGVRVDTELVYPFYKEWKILPGINYYQLKNSDTNYKLSVYEARMVLAREFEF